MKQAIGREETAKLNRLLIDHRCYSRDASIKSFVAQQNVDKIRLKMESIMNRQAVPDLRIAQFFAKVDNLLTDPLGA